MLFNRKLAMQSQQSFQQIIASDIFPQSQSSTLNRSGSQDYTKFFDVLKLNTIYKKRLCVLSDDSVQFNNLKVEQVSKQKIVLDFMKRVLASPQHY